MASTLNALWLRTLYADFIWLVGIDPVHASLLMPLAANGSAAICWMSSRLRRAAYGPLTSGAASEVHEVSIAVANIISVVTRALIVS